MLVHKKRNLIIVDYFGKTGEVCGLLMYAPFLTNFWTMMKTMKLEYLDEESQHARRNMMSTCLNHHQEYI